jgi:hypothetical protein
MGGQVRAGTHKITNEPGRAGLTCGFTMERVTGIEPALSAWELACHTLPTIVFAAQSLFALSVSARYRPPQTVASGTQRAPSRGTALALTGPWSPVVDELQLLDLCSCALPRNLL